MSFIALLFLVTSISSCVTFSHKESQARRYHTLNRLHCYSVHVVSFCGFFGALARNEYGERKGSNQHHAKMNIITLLTQAINALQLSFFLQASQKHPLQLYTVRFWEIFVIKMVYVNKIFEQVAESCLILLWVFCRWFVYNLRRRCDFDNFFVGDLKFNRYENCFPKTFHRLHRIQWLFKLHPYFSFQMAIEVDSNLTPSLQAKCLPVTQKCVEFAPTFWCALTKWKY